MSGRSNIEWTDYTFNPWSGCAKISAGCAHCYAAALPPRMRRGAEWGERGTRVPASEAYWRQPLTWNRRAAQTGVPEFVFCASTADVFEDRADLNGPRARLWDLIAETTHLRWLLLTKRPHVALRYADQFAAHPHAWLGVSVEDQRAADERVPLALRVPSAVRFVSAEPLLGAVDFGGWIEPTVMMRSAGALRNARYLDDGAKRRRIDWIIVGGESGRHARPMHPDWARSVRDQCEAAGVPFHFKQWGEWSPYQPVTTNGVWLDPMTGKTWDAWMGDPGPCARMQRIGKHAAGRHLDGIIHDARPTP